MSKVHILEGTSSDGRKHTACSRRFKPQTPTVGRALVLANQRVDEVTCELCRAKYRHYCDERKR